MRCSGCHQDKPLTAEYYHSAGSGFRSKCRLCRNEIARKRYAKNPTEAKVPCPRCGGLMNSKRTKRCMDCKRSEIAVDPSKWSPAETAWLAGIIESEGTIDVSPTLNRVSVVVSMTDRDIIERVAKMWNRHLTTYTPRNDRFKQAFTAAVRAKGDVRKVLNAILPWLGERRTSRALEALELLDVAQQKSARPGSGR